MGNKIYWKDILSDKPLDIKVGDWIEGAGKIECACSIAFIHKLIEQVRAKVCAPKVFIRCPDDALLPKRQYADDAGLDLRASCDAIVDPGKIGIIPTGVSIALPYGYEATVRPRSGLTAKGHSVLLGTIDAGYRGEIWIIAHNLSDRPWYIKKGDRIAQLVISPCWLGEPIRVQNLSNSERGSNGFGSTG